MSIVDTRNTINATWYGCCWGEDALRRISELLTRHMSEVGFPPTRLRKMSKERKHSDRRLTEKLFNETCASWQSLRFIALVSGIDKNNATNYNASQSIDVEGNWCMLSIRSDEDGKLWEMAELLRRVREIADSKYAVAYCMRANRLPILYTAGIGVMFVNETPTAAEEEEGNLITSWRDYGTPQAKYLEGFLRDVYPLNLINASQLGRPLFKESEQNRSSLGEWIQSRPGHQLEKLDESYSLWCCPMEDLESSRRAMLDAEMIFRREFVEKTGVKDIIATGVRLYNAGMMGIQMAMTLTLSQIGDEEGPENAFERIDGDVSRELRDLVHHIIENIPDKNVASWTEESTDSERFGLQRLIDSAKKFGYRKDDL